MTQNDAKINSKYIFLIILVSLVIKILFLPFMCDIYFDTGRMITLYNQASNFCDSGHFYLDENFVETMRGINDSTNKNNDYKYLEQRIIVPSKINKSPEIQDAWGYSFLLGFIWKITHDKSYLYIQVFQIILDVLASLAIFFIVLYLFKDEKLAFIGSLSYALFLPFIFMTIIANRDYYSAWGLIFSLLFFVRGFTTSKFFSNWIISGVMIAIFSWFRPTIILIPFVYAFYMLIKENTIKLRLINSFKSIAYILLPVIILFIIPFALQYHNKYNVYNFFSSISGLNLWEGLGEFPNKYNFKCSDGAAFDRAVQLGYPKEGQSETPVFNKILKQDAINIIKKDPGFYLSVIIRRYFKFVFTNPPLGFSEKTGISYKTMNLGFFNFLKLHPFLTLEKITKKIFQFFLPILAITSLIIFRKHWKEIILLLLIWQYKLFVHLPTHIEDRYIIEGYFPVVILSGLTIYLIIKKYVLKNYDLKEI